MDSDALMQSRRSEVFADGEPDHGNIDTFQAVDRVLWEITGDWGEAYVHRPRVTVRRR